MSWIKRPSPPSLRPPPPPKYKINNGRSEWPGKSVVDVAIRNIGHFVAQTIHDASQISVSQNSFLQSMIGLHQVREMKKKTQLHIGWLLPDESGKLSPWWPGSPAQIKNLLNVSIACQQNRIRESYSYLNILLASLWYQLVGNWRSTALHRLTIHHPQSQDWLIFFQSNQALLPVDRLKLGSDLVTRTKVERPHSPAGRKSGKQKLKPKAEISDQRCSHRIIGMMFLWMRWLGRIQLVG